MIEIVRGHKMANSVTSDKGPVSSGYQKRAKRKLSNVISVNRTAAFILSVIVIILALTGFVCTYKIQAEEECLSSKTICYECDSRYDPNCADPFKLSSLSLTEQHSLAARANNSSIQKSSHGGTNSAGNGQERQQSDGNLLDGANSNTTNSFKPKKMPNVVNCHGCCVKITSKTTDGATYVKRTCTTNLQINYFMVGLVCMKESGERGKMCFCETDYCNGQLSGRPPAFSIIGGLLTMISLLMMTKLSTSIIQEHISITKTSTYDIINSDISMDSGGRDGHPNLS